MVFFKEKLKKVKGFVFDVDGVLSSDYSPLDENGDPVRTANVKDGFAIRYALKRGYKIAIITGANTQRVKLRYNKLGVDLVYLNAFEKMECLEEILEKTNLKKDEILYMGDDLIDIPVMKVIGIPTCPVDAVPEVKAISMYISDRKGGEGCARDVIEQVLRAKGEWASQEIAGLKAD